MRNKSTTVGQLAVEVGVDVDELLIRLWTPGTTNLRILRTR